VLIDAGAGQGPDALRPRHEWRRTRSPSRSRLGVALNVIEQPAQRTNPAKSDGRAEYVAVI